MTHRDSHGDGDLRCHDCGPEDGVGGGGRGRVVEDLLDRPEGGAQVRVQKL